MMREEVWIATKKADERPANREIKSKQHNTHSGIQPRMPTTRPLARQPTAKEEEPLALGDREHLPLLLDPPPLHALVCAAPRADDAQRAARELGVVHVQWRDVDVCVSGCERWSRVGDALRRRRWVGDEDFLEADLCDGNGGHGLVCRAVDVIVRPSLRFTLH